MAEHTPVMPHGEIQAVFPDIFLVTGTSRPDFGGRTWQFSRNGTGLVLASKRLEQGRFAWPSVRDGVIRLSRAQFEALFEGLDWRRVWRPRVRRPLAAA